MLDGKEQRQTIRQQRINTRTLKVSQTVKIRR